ncbi:MAG TPA: hypothetical protein VLT47_00850 [Anaeromyxobacteraceae bacterium]|nr:hypothetical protein [Anaeromyxobacteraceae bacterium]
MGMAWMVAAGALGLAAVGAQAGKEPTGAKGARSELVEAQPPPFSEGIFPCSQCHDPKIAPPNRTRRALGFHADAGEPAAVFDHDAEHRWCVDCHDLQDRDVLRLASGDTIPFTRSYLLCGQCHGDKLRDWRVGVHGKRVGSWNGPKTYFLCVNCHNPHTPRFKGVRELGPGGGPGIWRAPTAPTLELLKPEPRPRRPEEDRL